MKRWQLLILILLLASCATTSGDVADESLGAPEKVCVNVRNITSFDPIDDRHIYIKARGERKHFLFTMHGGCIGLRGAQTIAVKDTMSSVCSKSFGEVVYRQMGRGLESCRIRSIEAVSDKDDARGLVEDRKREKREAQSESE
jgi:ABC-type cobalt transport system substrate-binding protein